MTLRPVLRPGVQILPRDDGWVVLADLPSGLRYAVAPDRAILLDHLGGLPLPQILEVTGLAEPQALPVLQSLALLGFLIGGDEDGRAARIEARATGVEALATHARFALLTETRYACPGCETCDREQPPFPFAVVPTSDGLLVSDTTRCAAYPVSSAAGPPLHEAFDAWRPQLRAAARQATAVSAGAVRLPGGVWASDRQVRHALTRALEGVDQAPAEAGAGVAWERVRDATAHWLGLLAQQGLQGDLAGRLREAYEGLPLEALAQPPIAAQPGQLAEALASVWPALPGADPLLTRAVAVYAAGAAAPEPAAAWDPALSPILRRALRQRVHGWTWETGDALATDLLAELLRLLLTAAAARLLAADAGADTARLDDLGPAQARVVSALARPETREALAGLELAAERVFRHATDLEAWLAGPVG